MNFLLVAAAFVCLSQANILTPRHGADETRDLELDRIKTDDWIKEFYDNCGRTWNVDQDALGSYMGDEYVKRCIGDTDGCVKEGNCTFAVSILERIRYEKEMDSESTTVPIPFEKWVRKTSEVNIKLLDTCHLYPLPNQEHKTNKFVGVTFGLFKDTGELDCPSVDDNEPFDDRYNFDSSIRAFFAVQNFSECNVQPNTPVHPYLPTTDDITKQDPIVNEVKIDNSKWAKMCTDIKETVIGVSFSANSYYMKHLLIHHYGTPQFSSLDSPDSFQFMDTDDVEKREIMFIVPKNRTVTTSKNKGSPTLYVSSILSLAAIVPILSLLH